MKRKKHFIKFTSIILITTLLTNCKKDNDISTVRLSSNELLNKRWKQVRGPFKGEFYNFTLYYDSLQFTVNDKYTAKIKGTITAIGYPAYIENESGSFTYDETSKTIKWFDVDSVRIISFGDKVAHYKPDWILEDRNDSMLLFKLKYSIDTIELGKYDNTRPILLKAIN
ncbi:hypothetical protein NF867_03970 [Solitalea sp. MAHUQ-68]|uniref:Uncharacterized protein n=1 Tax=Solitalea agri TaxID=2953739 RepID=A0A9X2F7B5_9SPHI|nr:hypothetical protein [Solitalea agri]MCO4292018.1 hypothetical protein [Solitalea agri]